MEIYLVGGAVRDQVLNINNSKDRDWVVVGAKPEYFIERGYQQVGKDFPVFLHPETNEEYALARVERKIKAGHTGFECYFDDSVTLEQDLSRRDLTINAMAMNADGEIVDPYGGQKDCQDKILRHVSPAFIEDPLRCLRIARFAAQLPGFVLAKETLELCKSMVANNDLKYLSKERIWQEWHKALESNDPNKFFQVMQSIGALELEVQSNFHSIEATSELRLALLASDIDAIDVILETIKPPRNHSNMALLCNKLSALNTPSSAGEILNVIKILDAYRQPERITKFLSIVPASKKLKHWNKNLIRTAYEHTSNLDVQEIISQGFSGVEIMHKLDEKRLKIIDSLVTNDI